MIRTPDDGVVYCKQTGCLISKRARPATLTISKFGRPWLPSCDPCARFEYEQGPGQVELGPLGEYVDMFAEAKQAMNATPGQVIRGEAAAPRQTWDTGEAVITPVAALAPAPVARAGNGFTAQERARRAASRRRPERENSTATWVIISIASVLGLVLCIAGAPDGRSSGNHPNAPMVIAGVLILLTGIITAVIAALRVARTKVREYQAWKATLTPEQLRAVEIGEIAAMAAGAVAVHEGLKHHHERSVARTATMRGHMARAGHLNDDMHQRQQQDQMAADLSRIAGQGSAGPDFMSDPRGYLDQRRGY